MVACLHQKGHQRLPVNDNPASERHFLTYRALSEGCHLGMLHQLSQGAVA
jgi:hypothetical protein